MIEPLTDALKIAPSTLMPRGAGRDEVFWDGCANGRLHVQECRQCLATWFPSQDRCPACGSAQVQWRPTASTGVIYTFTVVHSAGYEGRPAMKESPYPYAIVLVAIDGGGGARVCGNFAGASAPEVRVGMRVKANFSAGKRQLPSFSPY
jgi:uncharacterized OB-fold protein